MLLLRVKVPVDFYSSPIIVEVEGVNVKLQVINPDRKPNRTSGTSTPGAADVVPNPVDLAESFLEAQPSSEKKKMEEALAAEASDLAASGTFSDDGSSASDEGTGQPLSLPSFLAGFLQGIIDRMQVRINDVKFQLDMDLSVDPSSSSPEPVSFQVSLESISVEGVTAPAPGEAPAVESKDGKRHVALKSVRAYLISEANVFSALAQSPSVLSPSLASSPAMTRNPPTRENTLSEHDTPERSTILTSRQNSSSSDLSVAAGSSLGLGRSVGDNEGSPTVSHDASADPDGHDDDGPATPRASGYHSFDQSPEQSMFHSTILPPEGLSHTTDFDQDAPLWASAQSSSQAEPATFVSQNFDPPRIPDVGSESGSETGSGQQSESSNDMPAEDLTQSHLYTHEDAESMYMSAFSSNNEELPNIAQAIDPPQLRATPSPLPMEATTRPEETAKPPEEVQEPPEAIQEPSKEEPTHNIMPGGWEDEPEASQADLREQTAAATPSAETQESSGPDDNMISGLSGGEDAFKDPPREAARDEEEQDGFATPKGPTKLVKEFLSLENISIHVPLPHQRNHSHSPETVDDLSRSMGRSIYPQAPGAFSVHGAKLPHAQPPVTVPQDVDDVLEVDLSPISVQFDASLGFLLAMIAGKLFEAVNLEPDSKPEPSSEATSSEAKDRQNLKLNVEEVSIDFVNELGGVADTIERHLDPNAFNTYKETLLNVTVQGLSVGVTQEAPEGSPSKTTERALVTKVELEKLRFGYAKDDIVAFDNSIPMSSSTRDAFISAGKDVVFKAVQNKGNMRADIETLPLVVQIDLQRLDETFSWFGGLSSFLNMSSSMASLHSPAIKQAPTPQPKPRGVRFEAPLDPGDRAAAAESKVNLRIGGASIELIGKDCSLAATSKTVRMVSREEGLGFSVGYMRISGPHLHNSTADPAITADFKGLTMELATKPNDRDLERLLALITPSKAKYDEDDDEIMVDTLLRQRRKGSVLRPTIEKLSINVKNIAQLDTLPSLGEEIAKLSVVAKYLPEDDRPGLLTLFKIQDISASVDTGGQLGRFDSSVENLEIGHITIPSLVAITAHGVWLARNKKEELVYTTPMTSSEGGRTPVLMARMVGDEIEPVVKLKLYGLAIEYRVPFIMDVLGLADDATPQDFEACLAASVADLGDQAQKSLRQPLPQTEKTKQSKPLMLDVGLRDCLIGLNPLGHSSKMVIAMTDTHLAVVLPKEDKTKATFGVKQLSVLLIDDVERLATTPQDAKSHRRTSSKGSKMAMDLCSQGYVDVCYISSAKVGVEIVPGIDSLKQIQVDVKDDLLILETCADSMQTLITLANALKPPTPPSKEIKYRTNVMPMEDLLASISAEAFGRPEGEYDFDQDFAGAQEMAGSGSIDEFGSHGSLNVNSQHYNEQELEGEEMFDAMKSSGMSHTSMQDIPDGVLLSTASTGASESSCDDLIIQDDHFNESGNASGHQVAKTWNSAKNSYDPAPKGLVMRSPLKVSVRDVHVIWHLYDGYDWENTRDVISKAVQEVETKAMERQGREPSSDVYEEEIEDEEAIGDFLFNSIYIGIPANRDPQELARQINAELNDNATETESVATTAMTGATNRTVRPHVRKSRRLRLNRSKHHKITFELQGINADIFSYPPEMSTTESSIDVRVGNLDIIDNVPTSTWRKFATYDRDHGEREMGTAMVHLEILNVKPVSDLPVSEIVLRASVLPLRLHVDQDALDFITRFFEFKDEKVPVHSSPSDIPFIQRAEVHSIPVKLDFKPKRVDYAGLRSGHTSEFMNFVTLEESRMVLRHAIIYGTSGFDRLGKTLNDLWTPDVRNNQLPGVIAGLAPVRSLVTIGSGFKDLVEIPIKEYQKDGRVIRSISKGAAAFARTTGTEIVKLGAKLAVGTQYALQGAEEMFVDKPAAAPEGTWEDEDFESEDKKQISLYADPPPSVMQGLRGGYRSLARDVNTAKDAIIAVPGEVMQSDGPSGAARALWKRAPTIIFRPAMGLTKAVGQTLQGANNMIDPEHRRRVDEVSHLRLKTYVELKLTQRRNTSTIRIHDRCHGARPAHCCHTVARLEESLIDMHRGGHLLLFPLFSRMFWTRY